MQGFNGFSSGKQSTVSLPGGFFSDLLPQIDHLIELKVTLYCFWALTRQEGEYRYIRLTEACTDDLLITGLGVAPEQSEAVLRDGFERATARGTLLQVRLNDLQGEDCLYFLNSDRGRLAVEALERGEWRPDDPTRPLALIRERPTIYTLYEQNIGALTPMIAEQLRDIEREYPFSVIKDAIQAAVVNNARKLSYILAILKRWQNEGHPPAPTQKVDEGFMDFLRSYQKDE